MDPRRLGILLLLLTACGRGETPFAPGLEPLQEMRIEAPAGLAETFTLHLEEEAEHLTGHLRGYVHADMVTVWRAYQEPDVVVNRRRMRSWEPTFNVEEGFDFSLSIELQVEDTVPVRWTETWRHGAVGAVDEPDKVSMRWQKTEGSNLIDLLRGSVALLPTDDPDITEVQMIEHLQVPLSDLAEVEGLLTDVYADVVAHSHGRPLPVYE